MRKSHQWERACALFFLSPPPILFYYFSEFPLQIIKRIDIIKCNLYSYYKILYLTYILNIFLNYLYYFHFPNQVVLKRIIHFLDFNNIDYPYLDLRFLLIFSTSPEHQLHIPNN